MWIRHTCTHVPSLPRLPLPCLPTPPGWRRALGWTPRATQPTSHPSPVSHSTVHACQCRFLSSACSLLPCLRSVLPPLFLLCRYFHCYHFPRFHTYALIYSICFSLSNFILHNRLEVHLPQFNWFTCVPFLWLSDIFCIWWWFNWLTCICLSATPWTVAHQAPLSIEFSR